MVAFAPPVALCPDVALQYERFSLREMLVVTNFAIAAATWAVLMALAPLLQIRRMLRRRSPADVSVAYLLILLPGFALWVAYGLVSDDIALVIPNTVAFLIALATVLCAVHLRRPSTDRPAAAGR